MKVTLHKNTNSVVGIASRLRNGRSGVRIPAGEKSFLSTPKRPNPLWGPTSLLLTGTAVLSRRYSDQVVVLITRHHLALRLRISGVMPLFPLHAIMAWTGKYFILLPVLKKGSLELIRGIRSVKCEMLNLKIRDS
jgi:hypothetical protein